MSFDSVVDFALMMRKLPKECTDRIFRYSYKQQDKKLMDEIKMQNKKMEMFGVFLNRALVLTGRPCDSIYAVMYDYLVLYAKIKNIKVKQFFILNGDYETYKKYTIYIWKKMGLDKMQDLLNQFDEFLLMSWYFSNEGLPPFHWFYENNILIPYYADMISRYQNINNVIAGVNNLVV